MVYKCRNISKKGDLASVSALLFVCWTYPKEALSVLCVPVVVFTNSPQQNLPIGCPGLAKLPNSISFLWESNGLASWYSERQKERQKNLRRQDKTVVCKRAAWGELSNAADEKLTSQHGGVMRRSLTAVNGLHLPINGVSDHQGTNEELSPPNGG